VGAKEEDMRVAAPQLPLAGVNGKASVNVPTKNV
jgi:hypothetical protein